MIENVTAGGVYWNEAARLGDLLTLLTSTFERVVVVIQESTDDTLKIAQSILTRPGDRIRTDEHRGSGDLSVPMFLQTVSTEWTFLVSGDERPTARLLESIPDATDKAEQLQIDGWWIRFRSTIDGYDFTDEQDRHLRIFRTRVGWPHAALHSRPLTENTMVWEEGWIDHDRSLDEMIADYLRYLGLGRYSGQWTAHNQRMLHDACMRVAERAGWTNILSRSWWPEVRDAAFGGIDPQ